tara:strand:+ start:327 stop:611 length:285 start_codon:yes stop_codon:yes gene_type:complete
VKKEKTIWIAYQEPRSYDDLSYLIVDKQQRWIEPLPLSTLEKFLQQKKSQWHTFDAIIYSSTMDVEFPRDHGLIVSNQLRRLLERRLLKREEEK